MDSVTHIVAGAALGELTLGKKLGNRAMIAGAIANTIPDLDVFLTGLASTPAEELRIHRSYTHALFFHPFMALPFAYLAFRLSKKKIPFGVWYFFFMSNFLVHVLLDCCTTYGTQLFQPFTDYLVSWNNLSVVDPLFTIPLLVFFAVVIIFLKKQNPWRRKLALISIVLSLLYMGSSTYNKFRSESAFKAALQEQQLHYTGFSTSPTMFTSWLWNMIAYDDSTLYLGEWSVFQESKQVEFVKIPRNIHLIDPVRNTPAVETALWFSQGTYFVEPTGTDTLNFYITKWGRGDISSTDLHKMFPFYSKIYRDAGGQMTFRNVEPDFGGRDFQAYFRMVHRRIFDY